MPNTALTAVFEGSAGKLTSLFERRSGKFSACGHVLAQIIIETDESDMGQLRQDLGRLSNEIESINREIIELHHAILRKVEQSIDDSGRIDAIRFRWYMEAYRQYLKPIERLTTTFAQLLNGVRLDTAIRARVVECQGEFMETLMTVVDEFAAATRRFEGMNLSSEERSPSGRTEYEQWLIVRTQINAIEQLCHRTLVEVIEIFGGDDIASFPALHAAKQLLIDES